MQLVNILCVVMVLWCTFAQSSSPQQSFPKNTQKSEPTSPLGENSFAMFYLQRQLMNHPQQGMQGSNPDNPVSDASKKNLSGQEYSLHKAQPLQLFPPVQGRRPVARKLFNDDDSAEVVHNALQESIFTEAVIAFEYNSSSEDDEVSEFPQPPAAPKRHAKRCYLSDSEEEKPLLYDSNNNAKYKTALSLAGAVTFNQQHVQSTSQNILNDDLMEE